MTLKEDICKDVMPTYSVHYVIRLKSIIFTTKIALKLEHYIAIIKKT